MRLCAPKCSRSPFLVTLILSLEEYDLNVAVTAQGLNLDTKVSSGFSTLAPPHAHLINDPTPRRDC